jgi:hypothetical protein
MTNETILEIEKAIADTTSALSAYDVLVERTAAAQAMVDSLSGDIANLRTNSAGLDPRTRGNKFTATTSAESLAKSDLALLQDDLVAQKSLAVATGKAAARMLFDARDALQIHRVASVSARLIKEFEWSALPGVNPQAIASVHKSIRALSDLAVSQLYYQVAHDDSFVLGAVRHLGEVWSELKAIILEEGVELNIPAVVVPPIAKPSKPASSTNQLGSLNVAMVAA